MAKDIKCAVCGKPALYKSIYCDVEFCTHCRKNQHYYIFKGNGFCELCGRLKAHYEMYGKKVCKHCLSRMMDDTHAFYDFCYHTIPLTKDSFTFNQLFRRFKRDYGSDLKRTPPVNLLMRKLKLQRYRKKRWKHINTSDP